MAPDSPLRKLADGTLAAGLLLLGLACYLGGTVLHTPPAEEVATLRVAVAILSAVAAATWLLLRATRRQLARMDDLLDDVRYGSGTRRDRDAVDILIRALRTPDPHVRETARRTLGKITGTDLGEEAAAWEKWWSTARATFTRARAAPSPEKK